MSDPTALAQESPLPEPAPKPPAEPAVLCRILRGIAYRISTHFTAHRQRSGWAFFWRITFEGLIVAVVIAVTADALFAIEDDHALDDLSAKELIFWVCLAAPIYETLLQILPGELIRRLRARFWIQVLVVTVPFAALHFTNDFWSGLCAGVIGGFYLAFVYVHARERSLWVAISMTAASHAVGNTVLVVIVLVAKHFESLKVAST